MNAYMPFEGFNNSFIGSMVDDVMFDPDTGECHGIAMTLDSVARLYSVAFNALIARGDTSASGLAVDPCLSFVALESPREYNFTTDRILCDMPESTIKAMCDRVTMATLDKVIKDRHSSRSGFVSFYSNDIADWHAQGVMTWDANQLETLIIAYMLDAGFDDDWRLNIAYDIQPSIF